MLLRIKYLLALILCVRGEVVDFSTCLQFAFSVCSCFAVISRPPFVLRCFKIGHVYCLSTFITRKEMLKKLQSKHTFVCVQTSYLFRLYIAIIRLVCTQIKLCFYCDFASFIFFLYAYN